MMPRRNILALGAALVLLAPALAHAEAEKNKKPPYLSISGLGATIVRWQGGHGVMTVDAGIDVPDPALRDYADLVLPRLKDAYARTLQDYAGNLQPGAVPDADYMARKLQQATDRILGKPGARLLLGGIMVN